MEQVPVFNGTHNTFVELLLINRILFCDAQTRKTRKKKDKFALIDKLINDNNSTITNTNGATRQKSKSKSKSKKTKKKNKQALSNNHLMHNAKMFFCSLLNMAFGYIFQNFTTTFIALQLI